MKKIGIIITAFCRDELLYASVESLLPYLKENWHIIIVDQGNSSKEKSEWLHGKRVFYYDVPFDSGLSFCRNYGVAIANELECDYVLIGSDSFLFNDSIKKIKDVIEFLNSTIYSFCGFELTNCVCGWEAKLRLIEEQSFELNFIDKTEQGDFIHAQTGLEFFKIDICRNFFIAKTDILLDVKWDKNLKLAEHEDWFYRVKQSDYKGLWTDYIYADKMTDRSGEYAEYRRKNFKEGLKHLREKYNIKGWVTYKNLERAKRSKS